MSWPAEERVAVSRKRPSRRAAALVTAAVVVAAVAALLKSLWLATGLAAVLATGAALVWLNPSLSRLSFWVFVAVVVAAVPGPNLKPPGMPGMLMAYRVLLGLFVFLLGVRVALRGGRIETRLGGGPGVIWLPILGWGLVSLLWCGDAAAGLRYCVFLGTGVFLILAIQEYSREPGQFRIMLIASTIIAVAVILFGLFERMTNIHLAASARLDKAALARLEWMVTSVFRNPNELATYITLWFPVFAVSALESRSLRLRLASGALCAVTIYCLLCTGSRANMAGVGLGVATLIALAGVRRPVRVALALGLVMVVGAYGLRSFATSASAHQLRALDMTTIGGQSTGVRTKLISEGLVMLGRSGGAGVGAGNVEAQMAQLGSEIENVHNWWLEILVDLGVVSFALYCWFYGATVWGLYQAYRRAGERWLRLAALAMLAGLVGFTIGCVSSSSLIAWAPMWVYFGLCVGMIEAARAAGRRRRDASTGDIASVPRPR